MNFGFFIQVLTVRRDHDVYKHPHVFPGSQNIGHSSHVLNMSWERGGY